LKLAFNNALATVDASVLTGVIPVPELTAEKSETLTCTVSRNSTTQRDVTIIV